MNTFKKTAILLTLIILLAAILRLPLLDKYPQGITVDEAGQGYSAYSILKTGKDEWGDFFPLNPRGFGDYKPPVMMYLLIPSIAIFGLNEFAVRLPSAIAGIATVLVIFLLVRDLFKNRNLGLLSAFLTSISPWHVYYSRLGWESNIGLLFFTLGIWLFVKGVEKGKFLPLSLLSFSFSALSYHSFKLLVPLLLITLIVIFWKHTKLLTPSAWVSAVVIGLIFTLVVGYGLVFSGASRRAADQSILKQENLFALKEKESTNRSPWPVKKFFFNKYYFFTSKVADNYLGYFSLSFLFGPHRSNSSILNFPNMGLFYIWQLPLILLGVFYLLKNKSKAGLLLTAWIFLAPIPASLTQDYMHAGRAQALFPALTIVSAIGLYSFLNLLRNQRADIFKTSVAAAGLIILISIVGRANNYLYHTFNTPLGGLKQGYKEILNYVEGNKSNYDKIIFTKFHSEPHAFIGFYLKTDPVHMQNAAKNWKKFEEDGLRFLDMSDYNLGKYEFRNIDISRDRHNKNSVIIAHPDEVSPLLKPKMQIADSAGEIVFVVIETNEIPE